MAAVKRILGHVRVQTAKGNRQCERNKGDHTIKKGEPCFEVRNPPYPDSWLYYCRDCGKEMLARAKADLAQLEAELK